MYFVVCVTERLSHAIVSSVTRRHCTGMRLFVETGERVCAVGEVLIQID